MSTASEAMLAKVQKLLAKAESTNHPEEAQAFSAKAQQLMREYAISEAMLRDAVYDPRDIVDRRIRIDFSPMQTPKILLLDVVAKANDCKLLLQKGRRWDETTRKVANHTDCLVFGVRTDLEAVEVLWTSLLLQAEVEYHSDEVASARARAALLVPPSRRGGFGVKWRNSYMEGYRRGVAERFAAAKAAAEKSADVSSSTALVLASKADAVERKVAELFPRLGTSKMGGSGYSSGINAGRQAAGRADLGQKRAGAGARGAIR